MKLVAIITNVNQKGNENLVGQIVLLNEELTHDAKYELCYEEFGYQDSSNRSLVQEIFELKHSVVNVEIIGVL